MRNPCYHCHSKPAARHSNFCEECLPENRPLHFPKQKQPTCPFSVMAVIIAIAAAALAICEAFKIISK